MDAMQWYAEAVKDASQNQVALTAHLNQSTLSRQLAAGRLTAETVAAVARAYGKDVLDALVMVGLITAEDIRAHGIRVALGEVTDRELAALVWSRLSGAGDHPELSEPIAPA